MLVLCEVVLVVIDGVRSLLLAWEGFVEGPRVCFWDYGLILRRLVRLEFYTGWSGSFLLLAVESKSVNSRIAKLQKTFRLRSYYIHHLATEERIAHCNAIIKDLLVASQLFAKTDVCLVFYRWKWIWLQVQRQKSSVICTVTLMWWSWKLLWKVNKGLSARMNRHLGIQRARVILMTSLQWLFRLLNMREVELWSNRLPIMV
jgi:hypothetical protein